MGKLSGQGNLFDLTLYRENWATRDGRSVVLRSITPADKGIEKELIDGLSVESSRYRFFRVIKEATGEMIDQFCDIDYKNEVAIIAEHSLNGSKRNVGVVRLFIEIDSQTGEFAVLVADDFQYSGLGTKFMETLIDIGRRRGLRSIYGLVLADNVRMLKLAKDFGFIIGPNSLGEIRIEFRFH